MRRILCATCLSIALIAGCDGSGIEATQQDVSVAATPLAYAEVATSVELGGATVGDFYYYLSPLEPGETFYIELVGTDGRVLLRHHQSSDGRGRLAIADNGGEASSPVRVVYRNGSNPAGEEFIDGSTYLTGSAWFEGPEALGEPDSYHYEVVDGEIIVTVDYDVQEGGSHVRTLAGEWLQVTHVDFAVPGVTLGETAQVTFSHAANPGSQSISRGRLSIFSLSEFQLH